MKDTKLILIEGVSGSGKSTLAQFLTCVLTSQGIPCQWWYEEEKDHPLYTFHDQQSLQNVIDALSSGHHQQIIEAVLERWQAFSQEAQSSDKVTIIDGSLFGYLTWSLFPLDIPAAEIQAYLARVEQLIQPLQPYIIYLYQADLAQALERICERRGGTTRAHLMKQAIQSPYGKRRRLQDFVGMVTYWQDFRLLVEAALSRFTVAKFALENSAQDWPAYEQAVLDFLDLTNKEKTVLEPSLLESFVGTYTFVEEGKRRDCLVMLENGSLIVDNMPQVWPRTRLLPLANAVFLVESLPFQVTFEKDAQGTTIGMRVSGPTLL
jgi:thymidylate kinase